MLKIGVLGVGHLGKIHIKCIQQIPELELVGCFDVDAAAANKVAEQHEIKVFETLNDLINHVDVVDVVTPTISHFELAQAAIRAGKHVFVEKPITRTPEEANILIALAEEYNVKTQVGHVERYNPAFLAIQGIELDPMFIEVHRLATFNPRGTDVSVVLDLMIHDLDIILNVVQSGVKSVVANGVPLVSESADIANARIEFENGCIANVTASRMSMKQMRKLRFFQTDSYISLDFMARQTEIIQLLDGATANEDYTLALDTPAGKKYIKAFMPEIPEVNAILQELKEFACCILENKPTTVPFSEGGKVLALAVKIDELIQEDINKRLNKL